MNRSEGQPHDRLTRLCDDMLKVMEASPNYRWGDKCVVFVVNDEQRRGGSASFGYDEDAGEALEDLIRHAFGPGA